MTKKLFEESVYMKEANCLISNIVKKDDKLLIILDQTLFFPEGGGQPCDLGVIGDSKVLNVFEKDALIYHEVDKVPADSEVLCKLDWERRFDHMQQHCGEHILSGVFLQEYNLHNKGFHLGEDYVTIDIDTKELSEEKIKSVEMKANEAIYENHPILIQTMKTKEEANKFPLRKMPDIQTDVRVVQVQDVDCVACCGTHPSTTGEVGLIKILKWQKYKNMTRVFFKCGKRAMKDFQMKHEIISKLNQKYSSEVNTLLTRIEKESSKNKLMKDELNTLKVGLCRYESDKLIQSATNKIITKLYEDKSMEELQLIANAIVENKKGFIVFLCSLMEHKILLAQDGSIEVNCGKIIKETISDYHGRGGGSPVRAQAVFEDVNKLKEFYSVIKEKLSGTK